MGLTERQGGDERASQLAAEAIAEGADTAWFDRLYREARQGRTDVPWDRAGPHPLVEEWARLAGLDGTGRTALVVGCGLGYDAELLADAGFAVTAFDVSETGVAMARSRHPGSRVAYLTADLFDLPPAWAGSFDLVVEVFTVQALPVPRHAKAIACVTRLVAPAGTLLVVAGSREEDGTLPVGPPWPLTAEEIRSFGRDGLEAVLVERHPHPEDERVLRWRVELRRPAGG